jgi:hypothetical protein
MLVLKQLNLLCQYRGKSTNISQPHEGMIPNQWHRFNVAIIIFQFVEAVEKYRDVLRSVEEHKDTLKTDSLQQLHAMYNLREILVSKPDGVAPTLRDDQLPKQVENGFY